MPPPRPILLLALGAAGIFAPQAVAQRYNFKFYGEEQGLTNLAVQCFLQDRVGFLWVGTQNGLFRYDGSRFQFHGIEDGLPSARIDSIHQSPDGTLWVGTAIGLARSVGNRFQQVVAGTIVVDDIGVSASTGPFIALGQP